MGAFGGVLDILERSLGHLRWNLGHLGRVLERLGGIWGQFGDSWASFLEVLKVQSPSRSLFEAGLKLNMFFQLRNWIC